MSYPGALSSAGIATPALIDVLEERARQDAKWGVQNHDLRDWRLILGEEMGEFDQALLEGVVFDNGRRDAFTPRKIRYELVQVAAVALAMIECVDRNGVTSQSVHPTPPATGRGEGE